MTKVIVLRDAETKQSDSKDCEVEPIFITYISRGFSHLVNRTTSASLQVFNYYFHGSFRLEIFINSHSLRFCNKKIKASLTLKLFL